MTAYPLTDRLIEKIKNESHLIADADLDKTFLFNKVKKLMLSIYFNPNLNEDTLVKVTSGLIGLYLTDQNQK